MRAALMQLLLSPSMVMRKGRQRSGGRMSMHRFFSWFRGRSAMLQSSTRSVGVTMFRVYVIECRRWTRRWVVHCLNSDCGTTKLPTAEYEITPSSASAIAHSHSYVFISLFSPWILFIDSAHQTERPSSLMRARHLGTWEQEVGQNWSRARDIQMEREDELLPGKYSECSTLLVWATPQGIMGLPSVCF